MSGFSTNYLGIGGVFQHQPDTGEGIHSKVLLDTLDSGIIIILLWETSLQWNTAHSYVL